MHFLPIFELKQALDIPLSELSSPLRGRHLEAQNECKNSVCLLLLSVGGHASMLVSHSDGKGHATV